ncbi:bifunctional DNA primase/polymerase [Histidinibacterium aquaticum]|uniref:DNA primase/polymerase bifunctional N-terminal domain-containing protein n=1 Tax=Histidinibacterium aquaticum TaxID=2613962 RepID=A0A5J5GPS9_9RHOB|nr:bifunctional DNA primase/polymerase [Histidinibacterium aquaticum]KAA9010170.1 hypothetical protein F3S47_02660 [Histidinibacterium aquaticum]
MTALPRLVPSAIPSDEMARLHHAGFSLLPLGGGEDGKSPIIGFKGKSRLPLKRVLAPMHRTGSTCYGVRLDGLAVVDCDVDDPKLIENMEARFGASPVHVRTPRGRHLYYRASASGQYPNLRKEGLPVDIKRGANSYVAGPGSVRADGGSYVQDKGNLTSDTLPELLLQTPSQKQRSQGIEKGTRNYALSVAAIQMVETVDDTDELFGNLAFIRDDECEDPASIPDEELRKIAAWAWSKRLEGNVFRGRNSEFRINRQALDAIMAMPNATDALGLFVVLQSQHGHRPAVAFPLDHAAMKAAGHTDLSRERFFAARKALQEAGLLTVAEHHIAGKQPRTYRLSRLRPSASNVTELHAAQATGGGV